VGTGEEFGRFDGHEGGVPALAFYPGGTRLVSGSYDTTLLVWDVGDVRAAGKARRSAEELERAWADLAGGNGARAHRAVWVLARAPEAPELLRKRLSPAAPLGEEQRKRVRRLLADLDSDRFDAREAATAALDKLGEAAALLLRQALADRASAEARRRIEDLLTNWEKAVPTGDTLRALRAVEALEHIGDAEARRLLEALAKGAAEARLTREAKAALDRLHR
jgi:hypothetical protein